MTTANLKTRLDSLDIKEATAEDILTEDILNFEKTNRNMVVTKFVLTDDKPNGNNQQIPYDEFPNLVRSGTLMPIKMEFGNPKGNHAKSFPLGTIAKLVIDEATKLVKGVAVLWASERPSDIDIIKEMIAKDGLDISWEIEFLDEELVASDDGGTYIRLKNTSLNAATIVGNPAYRGRTPVLSVAEEKLNMEDDKLNEELEALKKDKEELEKRIKELEDSLAQAKTDKEALEATIAPLKEFKEKVEAEKAKAEKLANIRKLFSDKGVSKSEEYFAEKEEFLLGLDEKALDFLVTELAEAPKAQASDDKKKTAIPNLQGGDEGQVTKTDMVAYLRKS